MTREDVLNFRKHASSFNLNNEQIERLLSILGIRDEEFVPGVARMIGPEDVRKITREIHSTERRLTRATEENKESTTYVIIYNYILDRANWVTARDLKISEQI